MENPRQSSIHTFSGGSEKQREIAKARLEKIFAAIPDKESIHEREKTPEEIEIIEAVIAKMNMFLSVYGAQPLAIKPRHIHILDERKLDEKELELLKKRHPKSKGFYRPATQDVWLLTPANKSPLTFAGVVAHELVHFIGFNSMIIDSSGRVRDHRIGLAVENTKNNRGPEETGLSLFNETNEATTEGLVKRFFPLLGDIPALREEYSELEKLHHTHEDSDDIAYLKVTNEGTEEHPMFRAEVETFSYREYREADSKLFKEIQRQHPDEFPSEEDVFNVFARAEMTGNVKEMASLVESLGRGAFRALAKRQTSKE